MPSPRDLPRWLDAGAAVLGSGVLRPPGPLVAARMLRGLWRAGPTPALLVALGAARHPDRAVVVDDRGTLTYADLHRRAECVAAALHARRPGIDTVAVLCRNHRGFVEAVTAGSRLGAEIVLLNTELTPDQLARVLRRHRPDVLIHDAEHLAAVSDSGFDGVQVLAWRERAAWVGPTLDDLAERCGDDPAPANHGPARFTLLTSGTTGLAKGVSRSVDPLGLLESAATGMAALRLRAGDVALVPAPFFHALGFALMMSTVAVGGTVVSRRRFDARRALDDVREQHVTVMTGVPVMLRRMLQAHDPARDDVSSVRVALTGASPIPPSTVAAFQEVFGPVLVNLYGSTETGIVSIASPQDLLEEPGTLGRPGLGVSVRILRSDRTRADVGERGTIFMRGGLLFDGYTSDGDATPQAKEVVDRHVSTGDLGHLDAQGRLYVDGRDDDMVVTGGENVFPQEVEHVLDQHDGVEEAVVVGVEDEELGQVLRAYVKPAGGTIDEAEVTAFVRERLERFKVPRQLVTVQDFPRNGTGKVLRSALAQD